MALQHSSTITKIRRAHYSLTSHLSNAREVLEEVATAMSKLARSLAGVLVESLGHRREVFDDICDESTCFLRLNHYPICPFSGEVSGLVPHTDSDFLTILHQDSGGGLQLMKGTQWVAVKPNPEALVVNIGDLLQVNTPTLLVFFFFFLPPTCGKGFGSRTS